MKNLNRDLLFDVNQTTEFVRLSSLELVAKEIIDRNVSGNVAELGVYRGEFAKHINKVFKDRKLYLFDTFEGFHRKDRQIEIERGIASRDQDFTETSIELVLSKMEYPNQCVVKKGYFPDTAVGLEETFAFVSIDTDLYNPIYEGLKYFYPRLSNGGYIFVHDYNNTQYPGSKQAVIDFCRESGINYFPLCDCYGTAVILK